MAEATIEARKPSEATPASDPVAGIRLELDRDSRLLGTLVRRAAKWGWRDVYDQIRRGEHVRPFHRAMVEITLQRIKGQKPPPPENEYE